MQVDSSTRGPMAMVAHGLGNPGAKRGLEKPGTPNGLGNPGATRVRGSPVSGPGPAHGLGNPGAKRGLVKPGTPNCLGNPGATKVRGSPVSGPTQRLPQKDSCKFTEHLYPERARFNSRRRATASFGPHPSCIVWLLSA